ncbi:MAG: hypothetical protein JWL79_3076 [Frankiales bacterium]|nr:hypothetical protein [Frankiales bacterium]
MVVAVLERELYTETAAARLLRVPSRTLHYWLEGEGGSGSPHDPVIRTERKGPGASVTWAEFIEAGLLREYRQKSVPMAKIRQFIVTLRTEFDVPYPLADRRPWIDKGKGRGLVYEAQVSSGLTAEFALVAVANNQFVLTAASQSFLDRVDWDGDSPAAYRPSDDPASPVRCQPDMRFGKPAIRGISTAVLREQHDAGLDDDEIASMFEISEDEVFYALAYEKSLARAS